MDRIEMRVLKLERMFEELFICTHSRPMVVLTLGPPEDDPGLAAALEAKENGQGVLWPCPRCGHPDMLHIRFYSGPPPPESPYQ